MVPFESVADIDRRVFTLQYMSAKMKYLYMKSLSQLYLVYK